MTSIRTEEQEENRDKWLHRESLTDANIWHDSEGKAYVVNVRRDKTFDRVRDGENKCVHCGHEDSHGKELEDGFVCRECASGLEQ